MSSATSAPPRPEALRVLLEASSLLLTAGSEEQLLSQTLDLASNLLVADGYAVWREFEAGRLLRTVAQRGLSSNYPTTAETNGKPLSPGVWTVEDMATDHRLLFSRSVYEQEGLRSAMVVPWTMDKSIKGVIVFYWRQRRQFTADDVTYAQALSNLSASALHRLELHQQNQREKRRLAFLGEASSLLGSSLDYEVTLERVAQLAVPQIADWCTVHVAENGTATRLAVAYADRSMHPVAEEYEGKYPETISPDHGLGKVLQTGQPEVISPVTDEMLAAVAIDQDHLLLLRKLNLSASILVPLLSRGKVLGAIRLLGTNGHYFGDDDLQLAMDLGRRAAVAIENARLHRALLEQDAELRLSHAAAKMGSWTWDLERDRLSWSPEFRALHGLAPETEATGELGYQLVHPEDRERSMREFRATLDSAATVFYSEHRSLTPDGRVLWLQVRGRIRRDSAGKAVWVAGLIIDITESHLAEQALRRTEKLAAAGRLAATVAHEVNNPLEALVNLVYLAQRVEGLPPSAAEHLRIADGELRRITHIVRQTLGFYREPTFSRPTGIRLLVSEVLELYRARGAARGLTLRAVSEGSEEITATVVAGEIKQVVANLIANAIDATPPGGTVETAVRRFPEGVEIVVSDTGSGIAEAIRKHLFEPFFTTKADVGTGLGLWVSKGIVEKHGGTIVLDEREEPGTTVRVRLPLDAPQQH